MADKDVPMEAEDVEVKSEDEDDLLGTKDKKKDEEEYDSEAASEAELEAEDDRTAQPDKEWTWHVELYPIAPVDLALDNFVKLVNMADHSNVFFRTTESGERRGEAHFYANTSNTAKYLIRTICCRKFTTTRPFVYVYYSPQDGPKESAALRLDLIESAKTRWDVHKKKAGGELNTRIAKVSDVPLGTSKEFLSIVFARAYKIKRESDESEAEAAKKAAEAEAKATETNNEEVKTDEDKDQNNQEDDELVGEFNGNLTIDCLNRVSLKGFLLGYRRVTIGNRPLSIRAMSAENFNMKELRKESRKKRKEEREQQEKLAKGEEAKMPGRGGNKDVQRGRGARGARGGNANRGGIMTGRQKMEEKMRRGGGVRDIRGRGRGAMGYGYMHYQMAMNTYNLERQMISKRGRGRGFGLMGDRPYGDYPDPYEMPAMRGHHGYDYDPREEWAYRPASMPRYRDDIRQEGRLPMRGMRGRRK